MVAAVGSSSDWTNSASIGEPHHLPDAHLTGSGPPSKNTPTHCWYALLVNNLNLCTSSMRRIEFFDRFHSIFHSPAEGEGRRSEEWLTNLKGSSIIHLNKNRPLFDPSPPT